MGRLHRASARNAALPRATSRPNVARPSNARHMITRVLGQACGLGEDYQIGVRWQDSASLGLLNRLPPAFERPKIPSITLRTHHPQTPRCGVVRETVSYGEMFNDFIRAQCFVAEQAGGVQSAAWTVTSPHSLECIRDLPNTRARAHGIDDKRHQLRPRTVIRRQVRWRRIAQREQGSLHRSVVA